MPSDTGRSQAQTREWTLWVVAISCALHAAEGLLTGWQSWAVTALGIRMPTALFVFMNAVLVVAALRFASFGWRRPTLSLIIPTATLVNGICFHIVPTIATGHVAPGLYSAILLYLPFSTWALVGAARDRVPARAIAVAVIIGLAVAFGVVVMARAYSRGVA